MNISRLYDLVLLNKYITIYKNRFNDNIYVKFTLLWNALYLIFGEKKISETFLMPQEGSSECIDCIRLHSCVCQKKNDFNYNASICMILTWKMHFTDSICND